MPKIVTSNYCDSGLQRLAKRAAAPVLELGQLPPPEVDLETVSWEQLAQYQKFQVLRPRLDEQGVNVAYYNLLLAQGDIVTEYESGTTKVLSLHRTGRTDQFDGLPYFLLTYIKTDSSSPVRVTYLTVATQFLGTAAMSDRDLWIHPDAIGTQEITQLLSGQAAVCAQDIVLNKFNTLCLKSPCSEAMRQLTYPSIVDAFTKEHYVYKTTDAGTVLLSAMGDLNVNAIWGDTAGFNANYITISKLDLLT